MDPLRPTAEATDDETPVVKSEKVTGDKGKTTEDKGKGPIIEPKIRQIPRPPLPFP